MEHRPTTPHSAPLLAPAPAFVRSARRHVSSADWAPEHAAYIRWSATPKTFRKGVRTKTAYALHVGVSRTTLYKWETLPGFSRAVEALRADWEEEMDRLCAEMIALNMQLPGREGVQDRKLWLQYRGLLVEKRAVEVRLGLRSVEQMTLEEVDAALADLIEEAELAALLEEGDENAEPGTP
jgi:hypothetical protein